MVPLDDARSPNDDPIWRRRLSRNPFYVLGVGPQAPPSTVEAEAHALLETLARDPESRVYPTPIGPRRRDPTLVREAFSAVIDPDVRVLHEVWAVLPPTWSEPDPDPSSAAPDVMGIFGWRRRSACARRHQP